MSGRLRLAERWQALLGLGLLRLTGVYLLSGLGLLVIGFLSFIPLALLFVVMGWEFPSLGPIVTTWIAFVVFALLVTPLFLVLCLIRLIKAAKKRLQG